VLENLLVACEPKDRVAWLTDLVRPGTPSMTSPQFALIERLHLSRISADSRPNCRLVVDGSSALCRAIIARPSIVLLDEPAASLDESERADLGVLIRWLAELGVAFADRTRRRFRLLALDRLVAMDLGQVVASGSPEEVRSAPRVIAAYLGEPVPPEQPQTRVEDQGRRPHARGLSASTPPSSGPRRAPASDPPLRCSKGGTDEAGVAVRKRQAEPPGSR